MNSREQDEGGSVENKTKWQEQQLEGPEVQEATSESICSRFMVLVECEVGVERKTAHNCEQ